MIYNILKKKRLVIVAKRSGAKTQNHLSSLGNTSGWQLCPALVFLTSMSPGNLLHTH